jgi:hypothetical protein
MTEDPIVAEIHRIREQMLEECGGDLEKLMDRLKAREEQDAARLVTDLSQVEELAARARG